MQVSEEALEQATRLFGLGPVTHLGGQDGAVYEGERDGVACILKGGPIPPDRVAHATAATEELYAFMAYLVAGGVRLATPLRSLAGNWIEIVAAEDGLNLFMLSEKVHGHHVDCRDASQWHAGFFRRYGRLLGRMHALARRYPRWCHLPDGGALPAAERASYGVLHDWRAEHAGFAEVCQDDEVRQQWLRLGEYLRTLPVERDGFGLIHNDLHQMNLVLDDAGELAVIDWDVAGYHWFMTDIGIAVFHAVSWAGAVDKAVSRERFAPLFLADFRAGYREENTISDYWLAQLPHFLRYREILLYVVFSAEWQQPTEGQAAALAHWRRDIVEDLPALPL
ncbi:MAG: phosphotransferase enzyme family protein [Anaerolineae bacterium]